MPSTSFLSSFPLFISKADYDYGEDDSLVINIKGRIYVRPLLYLLS